MKTKMTVFLIALAIIFTGAEAQARVVQQEQSWLDKIFSNDSDQMVQKSPFSQPQKRNQNPRFQQPQKQTFTNSEDDRTQAPKQPEKGTRTGRFTNAPKNDLSKNYAERVQTLRQQRMNAMRNPQSTIADTVND